MIDKSFLLDADEESADRELEASIWSETSITDAIHEANRRGVDPEEFVRWKGQLPERPPAGEFRTVYRKETPHGFNGWWRKLLEKRFCRKR